MNDVWIDLLDPDESTLEAAIPVEVHRSAFQRLLATPRHDDDPRPRLETHGDYLFGVLVASRLFPGAESSLAIFGSKGRVQALGTLSTDPTGSIEVSTATQARCSVAACGTRPSRDA